LSIFASHGLKHKDAVLYWKVTALPEYLFHHPAKAQISSDLQKTDSDLQHVASELDARNESVAPDAKEVETPTLAAAQELQPEPEPLATTPKKKKFWGKLNPFRWKKHATGSDAVQ
jgi:hypothetical protein